MAPHPMFPEVRKGEDGEYRPLRDEDGPFFIQAQEVSRETYEGWKWGFLDGRAEGRRERFATFAALRACENRIKELVTGR